MVGTRRDTDDLEKLVAATKETYRLPADVNTVGIAAAVVEGRRNVLEGLVRSGGQMSAYPAVVATPYLIWANPLEILVDSHIEPWNNRARVYGLRQDGGTLNYSVGFFYFWDNPSAQNYALVNVASTLVTKGFVRAVGNTGILGGGEAGLDAYTYLKSYQGAAGEALLEPQTISSVGMYGVRAEGGGGMVA